MIDLNDRFIGLMMGFSILLIFGLFLIFFTSPEEQSKAKRK